MIVVDLAQLLSNETETCSTSAILMQKVGLCAASLLTYLQASASKQSASASDTTNGLLVLGKVGDKFGDTQIQIIKELYFYTTEMLQDFGGISDLMLQAQGNS